jgi:hypothetical protein
MEKRPTRRRYSSTVARYDYGHNDAAKGTDSFKIDSFDFKGRADMRVRNVGRYADNAMWDPSRLNENDQQSMLEAIHDMLSKADISDREIRAGIRLSEKGCQKVAAQLGIAASEVPTLVNSLTSKLRDDELIANEDAAGRFSHEIDFLNNVTIRDEHNGRDVFLRGSEAANLQRRIADGEDEQHVLGEYAALMEADDEEDFSRELRSNGGSYNFPWKMDGQHGTATASFRGNGPGMNIKLIHVRDAQGDDITPNQSMRRHLEQTARDFIGRE